MTDLITKVRTFPAQDPLEEESHNGRNFTRTRDKDYDLQPARVKRRRRGKRMRLRWEGPMRLSKTPMIKPIRSRGEIESGRRTTKVISKKKKRGEKAKMKTSQSRRAELGKKYDEPIIRKSGADEQKRPLKSPPSTITTMLILFIMFHIGDASLSAGQASLFHGENRVRHHVT